MTTQLIFSNNSCISCSHLPREKLIGRVVNTPPLFLFHVNLNLPRKAAFTVQKLGAKIVQLETERAQQLFFDINYRIEECASFTLVVILSDLMVANLLAVTRGLSIDEKILTELSVVGARCTVILVFALY